MAAPPTSTPTPIAEQQLFDVKDAPGYLRGLGAKSCTVNFIRTLIASGEIPHLRIGKKFYVSKKALDIWIATRERRPR